MTANNATTLPMQTIDSNITQVIAELLGTNPNHILTLRLAERRITPDVIMTFDIKPRRDGWTYPTPRGALRFKNADSNAPNKYAWIGVKRDTLLYGFDLREAIQQAGGNVWLTTEFDYFAMRSAGIYHAIAQLQGELQSLGTLVCHIAPDRDDQGAAWAQLVADKLTPVSIDVYARELPYPHETKKGGDIGKLWQGYRGLQPFERYLLNLPVTRLEAKHEIKKKKDTYVHYPRRSQGTDRPKTGSDQLQQQRILTELPVPVP